MSPSPPNHRTRAVIGGTALLAMLAVAVPANAQYRRMTDAEVAAMKTDETNRNDPVRFTNQSATHYLNSRLGGAAEPIFYFPPEPPPLGATVALSNPLEPGPAAPVELAPFANEVFYPRLAARLVDGGVTAAWRARLEEYRQTKLDLQNKLRAKIASVTDSEPAAREKQLAAFATEQTPHLAALELTAETLRTALRRVELFGIASATDDWLLAAAGRLKARTELVGPLEPAGVLRGLAYYQDGLTIEQRQLLREDLGGSATWAAGGTPEGPVFAFTPAPARIWLDQKPSPALQQKIDHYTAARGALKAELMKAFADVTASPESRIATARRLATEQAPRFAAAEALAEEIRRDLAAQPARLAAGVNLPPELAARIAAYRAHKNEALRKLHELLTAKPAPSAVDGPKRRARPSVEEFDRVQAELVHRLDQEKAAIRSALADYMRQSGSAGDRKSVDDLLRDFEAARQRQETWEKFRDYEKAALMPGLSPPQRRLLFDAAVVELNLPLPAGVPVR